MDTPETICPIKAPEEADQSEKSCDVKMSSPKAAHTKISTAHNPSPTPLSGKASYRIDKLLAASCCGSRKDIKKLCRDGRVRLGNQTISNAATKVSAEEARELLLDGQPLEIQLTLLIMMNKRPSVLTARVDRREATAADDLPEELLERGLVPVGRLDKDTSGLLLWTNDGALNHRLCSPRHLIPKVYQLSYSGLPLGEEDVLKCAAGLPLDDGPTLPAALLLPLSAEKKLDRDNNLANFSGQNETKHKLASQKEALQQEVHHAEAKAHFELTDAASLLDKQFQTSASAELFKISSEQYRKQSSTKDAESEKLRTVLLESCRQVVAERRSLAEDEALLVICEGRFHQVKRMLAALGREVTSLTRIREGSLSLDPLLDSGEWRALDKNEKASLYMEAGLEVPEL